MLHKCANPACSNRFRRLSQGKLFLVETEQLHVSIPRQTMSPRKSRYPLRLEYYWLCDKCSCLFTLTFEQGRGMMAVPLPGVGQKTVPVAHLARTQAAPEETGLAGDRGEQ